MEEQMAKFEVIEQEGVRLVKATLEKETIRTEAGALYYMRGSITMESKAPSAMGFLKSIASGESVFRPTYTGTGEVFLEPSFGGFHVFDLGGKDWILEDGAYWASEAGVEVDVYRDSTLTSFKSGEGLMNFQTKVRGSGKVVIATPGPIQELSLNNERLVVDGKFVVARPASMAYAVERAAKSILGSMTSGEGYVRVYNGTGTLLFSPVPYWRQRMHATMQAAAMAPHRAG
jgi:uncharacterized protein (AIM24 family)